MEISFVHKFYSSTPSSCHAMRSEFFSFQIKCYTRLLILQYLFWLSIPPLRNKTIAMGEGKKSFMKSGFSSTALCVYLHYKGNFFFIPLILRIWIVIFFSVSLILVPLFTLKQVRNCIVKQRRAPTKFAQRKPRPCSVASYSKGKNNSKTDEIGWFVLV